MKRNLGLDLIRCLAILFVVTEHAWYFAKSSSTAPNPLDVFGHLGVEMFFVLSGFLIGQIALKSFQSKESFRKELKKFYLRRWIRTLPLYYLLLTIAVIANIVVYKVFDFHPYHYVFLQSFVGHESDFYGVTWSLAVEEWFYLLLPLFFGLFIKSTKNPSRVVQILVMAIVAVFFLRFVTVTSFDLDLKVVKRLVPLRFDSLLIGVLLASVKMYYLNFYRYLANLKVFFLSLAGVVMYSLIFTKYNINDLMNQSIFLKTVGFTLLSYSIAGLIPFIESSLTKAKSNLFKPFAYIITLISVTSYSLYLVHLNIFTIFIKLLKFSPVINFSLAFAFSLLVSFGLYRLFEKPIMDLREKLQMSRKDNLSEPVSAS